MALAGTAAELWSAMAASDRLVTKLGSYPDAQHRHLARFQGRSPRVLEIGVFGGGSLRMWRNYFGDGAMVVGVDVDPQCAKHADPSLGIHVRIGDQTDRGFLAALDDELGPFDVVVDDGRHRMEQQLTTFEVLWPRLATPGVYLCEDAHTSYSPRYGGGWGAEGTFIRRMFEVVDSMHAWFGGTPDDLTRTVASVCFYQALVVVEKERVRPPELVGTNGSGRVARFPFEGAPAN